MNVARGMDLMRGIWRGRMDVVLWFQRWGGEIFGSGSNVSLEGKGKRESGGRGGFGGEGAGNGVGLGMAGGFARGAAGDGGAVHPGALDEAGFWEFREADFVAVELADEHIDGGGADEGVVLVHAGPLRDLAMAVEVGEAELVGDFDAHVIDPCLDLVMDAEDGIGLMLGVPCAEGYLAGGMEGECGDADGVRAAALLAGPESGGEAAIDHGIDLRAEDEGDAAVAEGPEALGGVVGGGVLVVGGEIERRPCGEDADDDAGEATPDKVEFIREAVAIKERGDDQAADVAGLEDLGEAGRTDAGLVKPEGVKAVAELGGALVAAGDPLAKGAEAGEGAGVRGDIEQTEGGLVLGGAAGAKLGHEIGYGGIGAVAHFRGELLDAAACLRAEAGVIAKGEGDGGLANAGASGDLVHGGAGRRWDIVIHDEGGYGAV